jgi:hypothetical protein
MTILIKKQLLNFQCQKLRVLIQENKHGPFASVHDHMCHKLRTTLMKEIVCSLPHCCQLNNNRCISAVAFHISLLEIFFHRIEDMSILISYILI